MPIEIDPKRVNDAMVYGKYDGKPFQLARNAIKEILKILYEQSKAPIIVVPPPSKEQK